MNFLKGEVKNELRGFVNSWITLATNVQLIDMNYILAKMRNVKKEYEIEQVRYASTATAAAFYNTIQRVNPGMYEYQVQAMLEHYYKDFGCADAAFETIIAGGNNTCILHYNTNRNKLLLEALPNFHLAGLDAVIYDPKRRFDPVLDDLPLLATPTHKGQFVKAERRVLIHDFANADELQHILYHEIGHHVFELVLSTALRRQWVLELSQRTSARITRYARRNALEDFAESYAVFVTDPGRDEALHRKYTYLREQVFGGVARNIDKGFLDVSI